MALIGVAVGLGAGAGTSAVVIGGGAGFLAFPTPWKRIWQAKGTPADDGLQFEALTLSNSSTAWLISRPRATYSTVGAGSAVCLCHGRSRSKAYERPLIAALAPFVDVLAFDFPGHGETRYEATGLGIREADAVDAALDALAGRGYQDILLYGCSMGGAASLISQGRRPHPAVRAVVTDGAFAVFSEVLDHVAGWLPKYMRTSAMQVAGVYAGVDAASSRPIDYVDKIPVPVLLLHGRVDHLVPPDSAARMAECSASATAEYYEGDHDEPHNPHMQARVRAMAQQHLPGFASVGECL